MSHGMFFALENDLHLLFFDVESKESLKYTMAGHYQSPEPLTVEHSAMIPGLGRADGDQLTACTAYLVTETASPIHWRRIDRFDGSVVFCVDELTNPDAITIRFGGRWRDGSIIEGRVASASTSKVAERLKRRFRAALKKHFTTVRWSKVGPQAMLELQQGTRLCTAIQSPPSFDLKEVGTSEEEVAMVELDKAELARASISLPKVITMEELMADLLTGSKKKED
jgi:hypothetical protein